MPDGDNTMTNLPASVANLTKPTRYISTTETAKLIRQALKEAFPEVKFSVKSSKYSGGSSISVSYDDGPLSKDVDAIAKSFQGGSFDGMTDCKGYVTRAINGEPTHFGADFVFVSRHISAAKCVAAGEIFAKMERDAWVTFAHKFGMDISAAFRALDNHKEPRWFAEAFLLSIADAKFAGRKSKLADSVVFIRDSNDHEEAA